MSSKHQTEQKDRRVASHLRAQIAPQSDAIYVKSKFLAEELDLTAREIGAALRRLRDADNALTIEKWSYTNATTWRISLQ